MTDPLPVCCAIAHRARRRSQIKTALRTVLAWPVIALSLTLGFVGFALLIVAALVLEVAARIIGGRIT